MEDLNKPVVPDSDMSRRARLKSAAWDEPVVAAAAVPMVAADIAPAVEEATRVSCDPGVSTTDPLSSTKLWFWGLDVDRNDGYFPVGQAFTITSEELDFSSIVTGTWNCTIAPGEAGKWIVAPASGIVVCYVDYNSPTAGTALIFSDGPVMPGHLSQCVVDFGA
jgi:hypothetical protein